MAQHDNASGAPEALLSPPHVRAAWPCAEDWPAPDAHPSVWVRFYRDRLGLICRPTPGPIDVLSYARKLHRDTLDDFEARNGGKPVPEDVQAELWDDARDIAEKGRKGPIGYTVPVRLDSAADLTDERIDAWWGTPEGLAAGGKDEARKASRGICVAPGRSSKGFPLVLVDVDPRHGGDLSGPWGECLPGPASVTPGGGRHTLVLGTGGERNSGGRAGVAAGVDVIASGGFVNLPAGSATPDRRWVCTDSPVTAPAALRAAPKWQAEPGGDGAAGRTGGRGSGGGGYDGPSAGEGGSGRAAHALNSPACDGEREDAAKAIVGVLARRGACPPDVVLAALGVLVEVAAGEGWDEDRIRKEADRWRRLLTRGPRDVDFAADVLEYWAIARNVGGGRWRRPLYARSKARSLWRSAERHQGGEVGTQDHAFDAEDSGDDPSGLPVGTGGDGRHHEDRGAVGQVARGDRPPAPTPVLAAQRVNQAVPVCFGQVNVDDASGGKGSSPEARGAVGGVDAERNVHGAEVLADESAVDGDAHTRKLARAAAAADLDIVPAKVVVPVRVDVVGETARPAASGERPRVDEATLRRLLPTIGQAYTRADRLKDYARRPLTVDVLYPFADFRTGELERNPGPGHGLGRAFSQAIGGISSGSAKVFGAPSGKSGKSHLLGQLVEGLALCTAARIIGDPSWANAPIIMPVWISEMPIKGEVKLRMLGRHCGFDFKAIRDGELAEDARGVIHMANELQWKACDVVAHARRHAEYYDDHPDTTALGFAMEYLVREIKLSVLPRAKGTGHFREDPRAGPALMDHVADALSIYRRDLATLLGVAEDKVLPVVLLDPCQHYAGDAPSQKSGIDSLISAAHSRICGSEMGLEGVLLATSDTTKAGTREIPLDVFLSAGGKGLATDVFAGSAGIVHRFDAAIAMSSEEPPAGVYHTTQYLRVLLGRDGSPAEVYPCDWEMHTGRFRAKPSEPLRAAPDPDERKGARGGSGGSRGQGRASSLSASAPAGPPGVGDDPSGPASDGGGRFRYPPRKQRYSRTDD